MPVRNVTVRQAAEEQAQGAAYVDVRSIPEFAQGHPKGAVNVPLLNRDERTGQMTPNPEFVAVIKASFAPDSPLLIGCQVGGRSVQATQILANAGFTQVANVLGGFGGARDAMGTVRAEGWVQAGLPSEPEDNVGQSYRRLLAVARQPR